MGVSVDEVLGHVILLIFDTASLQNQILSLVNDWLTKSNYHVCGIYLNVLIFSYIH